MKTYFLDIHWYDYGLYLVYILLFVYLLHRIGRVAYGLSSLSVKLQMFTFLLYAAVLIADSFLDFLPFLPDTGMYTYMIKTGLYPDTTSVNILALYYFSIVIAILCLNSPIIFTFFNVFFFLVAVQFMMSRFPGEDTKLKDRQQTVFAGMMLFWPAGLMYLSVPLRETYILLATALFLAGFFSYLQKRKFLMLLTGSVLLLLLRLQLFVCLAPLAAFLIVLRSDVHRIWKLTTVLITIGLVLTYLRFMILGEPFSPEALSALRNEYIADGGNLAYGNVAWKSYGDMLVDMPFLVLQFMLSPMPIFSSYDTTGMTLANLDVILVITLLLLILADLRFHWKHYRYLLAIVVVFAVVFAMYEYHLTGAVRHRMPMVMMLMIPAAATAGRLWGRFRHD
ncbi:MAG: hypothetical protein R2767_01035 [Chitinophagales bacterium]